MTPDAALLVHGLYAYAATVAGYAEAWEALASVLRDLRSDLRDKPRDMPQDARSLVGMPSATHADEIVDPGGSQGHSRPPYVTRRRAMSKRTMLDRIMTSEPQTIETLHRQAVALGYAQSARALACDLAMWVADPRCPYRRVARGVYARKGNE